MFKRSTMLRFFSSLFLAVCLLVGLSSVASAAAPAPTGRAPDVSVMLIDEGSYEILGNVESKDAPQTAPGKTSEFEALRPLNPSITVPAVKGATFGFRFILKGHFDGPVPGFEMVARHPPMRGVDGQMHTSQSAPIMIDFYIGAARDAIVYTLNEDFEMLPGPWALEVRYQGQLLMSRKFTLVAP